MAAITHTCPRDSRYTIEFDPAQCFPLDPGAGTPAMVYGPGGASATFGCAIDAGELDLGEHELPPNVLRWLQSMEEDVLLWTEQAFATAGARK